jgi:phosphate-selective porin
MFLGGDKTTKLQYYVSLTNGYGVFETENNNLFDAYALTGRAVYQPIDGLMLGASYRYMENPNADPAVTTEDTKSRFGFDAQYSFRDFTVIGEYINGTDEGSYLEGGGCGGDPVTKIGYQDAVGYYGTLVYRWRNFEPVYKFEAYDTKKGEEGATITTDNVDMWQTFGLNYYPNDWTRLQVNYIYKTEDPAEIDNDCLLVQLQVKF